MRVFAKWLVQRLDDELMPPVGQALQQPRDLVRILGVENTSHNDAWAGQALESSHGIQYPLKTALPASGGVDGLRPVAVKGQIGDLYTCGGDSLSAPIIDQPAVRIEGDIKTSRHSVCHQPLKVFPQQRLTTDEVHRSATEPRGELVNYRRPGLCR
jgi:hypothetical protein